MELKPVGAGAAADQGISQETGSPHPSRPRMIISPRPAAAGPGRSGLAAAGPQPPPGARSARRGRTPMRDSDTRRDGASGGSAWLDASTDAKGIRSQSSLCCDTGFSESGAWLQCRASAGPRRSASAGRSSRAPRGTAAARRALAARAGPAPGRTRSVRTRPAPRRRRGEPYRPIAAEQGTCTAVARGGG